MSTNSSNIDNIPAGVQGTTAGAASVQAQQGSTTSAQGIPQKASEVPLTGLQPGEDVPFAEQVKGHAKMFAGKVFGNDKEVQQGAEKIAGVDQAAQKP